MSEGIARYFGTARYLVIQTVLVIAWIGINALWATGRWDPYPFILLNLAFSTQAAYAAPLILLAQNRQAERDRREYEQDRQMTAEMRAETDFLARELAAARLALGRIEAAMARRTPIRGGPCVTYRSCMYLGTSLARSHGARRRAGGRRCRSPASARG